MSSNAPDWLLTLAQSDAILGTPGGAGAAPTSTGGGGGAPASNPLGGSNIFLLLIALLVVMIFFSAMSGRKERRRRAEMLASLSRNDRVRTVAGIIGSVVELKGDEMVLKVDDQTNTRIRFARSAVQEILRPSRTRDKTPEPENADEVPAGSDA